MAKEKKKRNSYPSRVYEYGIKIHKEDLPTANDILFRCHLLKNELVAIELERRSLQMDIIRDKRNKELKPAREALEYWEKCHCEVEEVANIKREERVLLGSRRVSPETEELLKEAKSKRKNAWGSFKTLRNELLYENPRFKDRLKTIEDNKKSRIKQAKKENGSFWPFASDTVNDRLSDSCGAPPRYMKYSEADIGKMSLQMHVVGGHIPCPELFERTSPLSSHPNSRWFQIDSSEDNRCRVSGHNYYPCKLRIGTQEGVKGSPPIWLPFRVKFRGHRELPENGVVRYVRLVRKRTGVNFTWFLQLVVSIMDAEVWPRRYCGKGTVAIMPGWAKQKDGIRVATYLGEDGNYGHLILPNSLLNQKDYVASRQSIRDDNLSDIKKRIGRWLSKNEHRVPEEARERLKNLRYMFQPGLSRVWSWWRDNRWKGDNHIFQHLSTWRLQDKHMLSHERFQDRKIQNRRRDRYRNFAAEIAARYEIVLLPNIKWSNIALSNKKRADDYEHGVGGPELSKEGRKAIESHRRIAAVSVLIELLESAAHVVKVDASAIASRCGECGALRPCSCGLMGDENRVLNLLRKGLSGDSADKFFRRRRTEALIKLMHKHQLPDDSGPAVGFKKLRERLEKGAKKASKKKKTAKKAKKAKVKKAKYKKKPGKGKGRKAS